MTDSQFSEIADGLFIDPEFLADFQQLGLTDFDSVFRFDEAEDLHKSNIAGYRKRLRFDLPGSGTTVFMKRYDNPSRFDQIRNWISHGKRMSMAMCDMFACQELADASIRTARVIAYGQQWTGPFEKRSFIATEKIPDAQTLEQRLPVCFEKPTNHKDRLKFIDQLSDFARTFHNTGLRHRDFYLAHIFMSDDGLLYLIDLHRTFRPRILGRRFQVKDIAQLYYSAPGMYFSEADRLRFYYRYLGREKLNRADRRFIRKVKAKAWRMADHDIRHGRPVPFAG